MKSLPWALQGDRPSEILPAPEAVTFHSGEYKLSGFVFKPSGEGPFAAIVFNHGSERDPSLDFTSNLGRWFQERGFVVFFPYRRGTTAAEGPPTNDGATMLEQFEAENDDVLAAIAFLGDQRFVDRRFIAVSGCSFGGIQTVLTAERSPEVYAAVDFAGASFSWASSPQLQERLVRAARNARVPTFYLQAENDHDTTPSLVLSREQTDAGHVAKVKIYPRHGATEMQGHAHFYNYGMYEWGPDVLAFLRDSAKRRQPGQ